ncbi:MAG: isopentenyl-diphosphate Delta-isomerase [Bacteroidetes bacterium]|nr:isopentenyl-diphosphate Delta-isomerase [Bacteroidota bacterium]
MNTEFVILVNEKDEELGSMEKMQAHFQPHLHRAISVFVFNKQGDYLLQKRANTKYHSAGLWTNTCCTHPRPKEMTLHAAQRRLQEEMGINCPLHFSFSFIYKTSLGSGLFEHELDHVFLGYTDAQPLINENEVSAYQYLSVFEIEKQLKKNPAQFTAWFPLAFDKIKNKR